MLYPTGWNFTGMEWDKWLGQTLLTFYENNNKNETKQICPRLAGIYGWTLGWTLEHWNTGMGMGYGIWKWSMGNGEGG